MIVSSLPRILLLSALHTAGAARAVGLGEINLHSRTGEPLRAELPIQTFGEPLDIGCIALAPAPGADFPVITAANLRLTRLGQNYRLIITGNQPIYEPIVVARIRVGCGFELQREYVLLPAPPLTSGNKEDEYLASAQPPPRRKMRPVAESPQDHDIDASVARPPRKPRADRNPPIENAASPQPADQAIDRARPDHPGLRPGWLATCIRRRPDGTAQ